MNLHARHAPLLLAGGLVGAAIGWLIARLAGPGLLPEFEKAVGQRVPEVIIGGLGGLALTVLLLLFTRVRDPNAEAPRNFTRLNGTGSALFGRLEEAADGSYVTTEWFTVLFVPIFPIAEYRVTELAQDVYEIHSKAAPSLGRVLRMYSVLLAIAAGAAALFYYVAYVRPAH